MKITPEEKQSLKAELVLENVETLSAMTKSEIYNKYGKKLLSACSRDTKDTLIQRLMDYVADSKIKALNDASTFLKSASSTDYDKYKLLEVCLSNGINAEYTANEYFKRLEERYKLGELTASTMGKTERQEIRRLTNQLQLAKPEATNWSREVSELVSKALAEYDKATNNENKKDLNKRGQGNRKYSIDIDVIMDWINTNTKKYLAKPTLTRGWHDVAFILALTSGRRMVEIHGEQCKFEKVGEWQIKAVGLAKKMTDDFTHVFYTLIPAKDWMELYNKLPEDVKNLGEVNGKCMVNGKVARDLNPKIKAVAKELNFITKDANGKTKYGSHSTARKFYARYCMDYLNWNNDDDLSVAMNHLAHDSLEPTLSYRDILFTDSQFKSPITRNENLEYTTTY